ncbi:MAG: hypothetical protein DME32_18320, partial [Verrucomicrobia bacterium]
MFVKICGITNQVDAELAIAAGADALGFNFWPGSRRYLEPAKAADWIRELPDTVVRVGVVVNPTESYATTITALDGIDLLQLHGAESPEFCLNLVEADILLWKAIAMTGPGTWLPDYHAERILLDTVAGGKFGGTGVPFPWRWARALIMANPTLELILAQRYLPGPRFYCCCALRLSVRKPAFEGVGNKTGGWSASCFNAFCFNQHRTTTMATFTYKLTCGTIAFLAGISVSFGQTTAPAPESTDKTAAKTNSAKSTDKSESVAAPLTVVQATSATSAPAAPKTAVPQPSTSTPATTLAPPAAAESVTESGGVGVREFQGDDVGQVLRLLARQAKVNMVVSDQVTGTVTMRLEDVTALQAIAIIVKAKGLSLDQIDHVYYIKTPAEKTAEPTESDNYQFSYSRAKEVAPLLASQLASKDPPQFDERTNTIFFRETRSNLDNVRKLLVTIDKPTKQVMIEARLVEVTANPNQSYGIDWSGVVGSASNGKTFSYGAPGSTSGSNTSGNVPLSDFALGNPNNPNILGNFSKLIPGQFAILSVPQMSATLRLLNEDNDAEFLANPRIVTADNLQAKIEINRAQPVPQLNFNEQTATAVFGGFQDKKFGNTLIVTPSINKHN